MKDTGIVRRVDDLGRIVIPMELRRTLGINVKDPMAIMVDGDKIILQKHRDVCSICGSPEDVVEFFTYPSEILSLRVIKGR